jgi:gluconate kinase
MKIYFVAGASGSGKSSIKRYLREILGDSILFYDFDEIGVPKNADKKWRQQTTEQWLERLLEEDEDSCLLGQMVLGEILSCPSAKLIMGKINFCLLDVNPYERIRRLKTRNTHGVDQHMLNWAAWLYMHHKDPSWMQQVIKDGCWDRMDFSAWEQLDTWDNKADIKFIDTSSLSIRQVAEEVAAWIKEMDLKEHNEITFSTGLP